MSTSKQLNLELNLTQKLTSAANNQKSTSSAKKPVQEKEIGLKSQEKSTSFSGDEVDSEVINELFQVKVHGFRPPDLVDHFTQSVLEECFKEKKAIKSVLGKADYALKDAALYTLREKASGVDVGAQVVELKSRSSGIEEDELEFVRESIEAELKVLEMVAASSPHLRTYKDYLCVELEGRAVVILIHDLPPEDLQECLRPSQGLLLSLASTLAEINQT